MTVSIPKLSADSDNLAAAATYAASGLYVLPVKPGTKHPGSRVGMRWQDKSSRDPEQIVAWWAGTSDGIAIDIGRSGLIVIDVDRPDMLPEWLWRSMIQSGAPYQQTRPNSSGRGHYVFLMPKGRRIGNGKGELTGMGLDIRGAGGVIIVSPTVHPDGGEYKWLTSGEIPEMPDDIAGKLRDTTEHDSAASDTEVMAFIDSNVGKSNPRLLATWTAKFKTEAAKLNSRHDAMVSVLTAALEEAKAGFFPARDAIDILREQFVTSMLNGNGNGGRALSERAAQSEFGGILSWAIGQANTKSAKDIRAKVEKSTKTGPQQDAKIIDLLTSLNPVPGPITQPAVENGSESISGANNVGLRLTPASKIASAAATWAWEFAGAGRIQLGTMTLMGGRPGAGKSTAARWFAAGYSTGRIPGCFFGRPVNVVYLATEESTRYVIRPSLDAAGADTNRIFLPSMIGEEGPTRIISASHETQLAKSFRENEIRIVIVDPIMSTIPETADTHRNNETRLYLEPWARLAEVIDGIVIGIVHLNKSANADLVAAINGSSAFGEIARSVFGFVKSRDGTRIMSQVKNSTGREDLSVTYEIGESTVPTDSGQIAKVATFEITGLSDLTAADSLIADADPSITLGGKSNAAECWLADYISLHGPWVRAKDAVAEAKKEEDISRPTLYRAAKRLKVIQELRDMPAKSYWRLPTQDETGGG